ncbi:outer membrane chaperone Skp (OmpH) [Chloroherpeton thalassium ATCC 35110]|uniref:Outer membrane chaperone Skp (OmpH) n=1 Tax=Chloroherpeton thalassium (strain ATCC 35110 / GB-78) TaxID=517418 RepID=B3QTQ6_CHLT3|nr:OmpH family outer membrane protein [Chloroherpeton thalassium]ACF14254.1 outer membrane chaperone Skp (OmpH) [Chloroherpeton thalassium ATCC 35110]
MTLSYLKPAIIFLTCLFFFNKQAAVAQQKIGYVESDKIMAAMPEFSDLQGKLSAYELQWKNEIAKKRSSLDSLFKDYQSKEILYTEVLKESKKKEILKFEQEIAAYQNQKFGVSGEYFKKQTELMKPIQTRIFNAMKMLARDENYDFVFDKSGEILLLYTNEEYNLTQKVIDIVTGKVVLDATE